METGHPRAEDRVGGSLTVRELGILEKLRREGYTVHDHWKPGLSRENISTIRKSQMTSDLFLSSSDAITLNGELVNIDGIANRVNSANLGPERIIPLTLPLSPWAEGGVRAGRNQQSEFRNLYL